MADTIKKIIEIEFSVNNGPIQKFSGNVEEVTKKVEDLEKAIATIPDAVVSLTVDGVETSVEDIKKLGTATKEVGENTKTLKQQYRDAVTELQKFTKGTKEYEVAKARAGALKDELEDLNRTISANKSGADAVIGSLQGVAGGFAIAQGAAGLFGGENEKVQQALLKVQSALALVQGLEALKDSFASFQALGSNIGETGNKIGTAIASVFGFGAANATAAAETELLAAANTQNAVATEAAVVAEGEAAVAATALGTANAVAAIETEVLGVAGATAGVEVAVGMETATAGTIGFAAALTATGIGAILVGIGAAITLIAANWDNIKGAVSGVSAEQRNALKSAQENTTAQKNSLDLLNSQDETLKAQGKTEDEILQLKIEQTKKVIESRKQELLKAQEIRKNEIAAAERNQKILEVVSRVGIELATLALRVLAAPVDAIIAVVNKVSEKLGLGEAISFSINGEITKINESLAKSAAKLLFDPEEMKAEGKKADEEANKELVTLQNTVDGYENKRKEKKTAASKAASEAASKAAKELEDIQKKHQDNLLKLAGEYDKLLLDQKKAAAKTLEEQQQIDFDQQNLALKQQYDAQEKVIKDRQKAIAAFLKSGVGADGKKLTSDQISNLKTEAKGLNSELLQLTTNRQLAETNLEKTQGDARKKLREQNAKEVADFESELNGQTADEKMKVIDIENEALRQKLTLIGVEKEKIDELIAQRNVLAGIETKANIDKLSADKKYFEDLKALYDDNTLSNEARDKKIKALDANRAKNSLAIEKKANEDKMKLYDENSDEYKALAARNAEIDAEAAKTTVETTQSANQKKLEATELLVNKSIELLNALADAASALLAIETKRVEEEYEKRLDAQQKKNDKEISNVELTDAQRVELERENALELAAIEEEKQAKLKEIKKKQADIDLAITIAQIIATTGLALLRGFSDLGPIAGAVAAGLTAAIGAVQIATAIAQRQAVAGLARGGMVYGVGGPTDDMIPIMASNGEAVINARAVTKFAPVLSAINESTGGAPIKPRFAAGGIVTTNPGEVSVTNINDIAAITGQNAVRAYILESDVTSNSVKNQRITRNARIK